MNFPTSAQIGQTLESIARRLAVAVAVAILLAKVTYDAGYALGRIVHGLNDWLADATHHPVESAAAVATAAVEWADRILTPPAPDLLSLLQAEILTEPELQAEIVAFDTAVRRKSAKARKVPAAA